MLKSTSNSKVLNFFKKCDRCPLKPRIEDRFYKGKEVEVSIPSKCVNYREGQDCVLSQKDLIKRLEIYFDIGEKADGIALQQYLTYSMLEDAELSKDNEMLKTNQPGFFTHKFKELASKNQEVVNKLIYGEKTRSENVNVNINVTDAILAAYNKRKQSDN
jgi:hypothetical protein